MKSNKINTSTMNITIPFDSYLELKKEKALCDSQNEALKKATKGIVIVLAEKPENLTYNSYTDIAKLNFIDIRYEKAYEFMTGINENLKQLTDERVKHLIEKSNQKDLYISKLESRLKKYVNESEILKANESLIKKIKSLQERKDSLEEQFKASKLLLEKEFNSIKQEEFLSLQTKIAEIEEEMSEEKENLKTLNDELNKKNLDYYELSKKFNSLRWTYEELSKNYLVKIIKFFIWKKRDKM